MAIFRGIRQTIRGGAGAGRGDDPHPRPQAKAPAPVQKAPAPSAPAPSGKGRYLLKGGGYLTTTPTEGFEGRRHDVTVWGDDHVPSYSVKSAEFGHNPETGQAKFFGGTSTSSGQVMGHTWTGQTLGGNLHKDTDGMPNF